MAKDVWRSGRPDEHDHQPEGYATGDGDGGWWAVEDFDERSRRADPGLDYTETWWWIPGPHTGHGPQDYVRADSSIVEKVNDRLTQHGWIDARDVKVDVQDGEVTLRGTVPDRRTKRLAEDVAESVAGVRDVHNRLRIRPPGAPNNEDRPAARDRARQGTGVVARAGDGNDDQERGRLGQRGEEELS